MKPKTGEGGQEYSRCQPGGATYSEEGEVAMVAELIFVLDLVL